jgi:glutathione S-transferase
MNKTRIYSGPLSLFGAKAQIAALEKGLDFELVMVPFDRDDNYLPKHPDVLRVNPKAQVPVLIDDQVELFDSTQIFEYLEDRYPTPALWPREPAARAGARQLELRADEIFFPHIYRLFGLQDDMQGAAAQAACAACLDIYAQLEKLLAGRDYLAGPYTYADIGFYMACVFADRKGAGMTRATPRLLDWRARVGDRPAVRAVVDPMMHFLASQGRGVPAFLQRQ